MNHDSAWELIPMIRNRWKDAAIDIINGYVMRTEGSYCEVKETSVVFQYRNADPDYGDWQAKELTSQLDILMRPYMDECEVCSGNGYVEVKPRGINKGTALRLLCKRVMERMGPIDFIMSVGDDVNDEEMFTEIKQLKTEQSPFLSHGELKIVTCTIGKKPSQAKFYINDSNDLTHILELLISSSIKVGDM
jgi:trehalose 6-phosphate synthase/phosphatase